MAGDTTLHNEAQRTLKAAPAAIRLAAVRRVCAIKTTAASQRSTYSNRLGRQCGRLATRTPCLSVCLSVCLSGCLCRLCCSCAYLENLDEEAEGERVVLLVAFQLKAIHRADGKVLVVASIERDAVGAGDEQGQQHAHHLRAVAAAIHEVAVEDVLVGGAGQAHCI